MYGKSGISGIWFVRADWAYRKKGVLNPIPPYFLCQPAKYSDRPTTLHLYVFISLYPHLTEIGLHIYDRTYSTNNNNDLHKNFHIKNMDLMVIWPLFWDNFGTHIYIYIYLIWYLFDSGWYMTPSPGGKADSIFRPNCLTIF